MRDLSIPFINNGASVMEVATDASVLILGVMRRAGHGGHDPTNRSSI